MGGEGQIAAVVLAGGAGRRMGSGEPKFLRQLGAYSLLEHALARIAPQVSGVILSCNLTAQQLPVNASVLLADTIADAGPLAGVLAALEWLRVERPQVRWLVSVAADTPGFPGDLVARLHAASTQVDPGIAVACSGGRTHPVFALWPVALADALRTALQSEGLRKVDAFQARYPGPRVEWSVAAGDPFFNINTPQELLLAQKVAPRMRHPDSSGS